MFAEPKVEQTSSEADSELSSHAIPYHTVLPATAIQISSGEGGQGIHTLTMTNATAGGAIVQYSPGQEFFVPVVAQGGNLSSGGNEDQARKREMRLLKNREAAAGIHLTCGWQIFESIVTKLTKIPIAQTIAEMGVYHWCFTTKHGFKRITIWDINELHPTRSVQITSVSMDL
ncbi:uncharacterized protein LOC115890521 [Sitophilus oryzae]|uniref:Uncharacterized protein LOC115890521 n=1 Tax=Sitophilus oryzae TaxID=7048 RepID=A0A6J2YTW2_SITOR|nr:uncharacterized protein LOC115890521 [Sitophilus oryzae]